MKNFSALIILSFMVYSANGDGDGNGNGNGKGKGNAYGVWKRFFNRGRGQNMTKNNNTDPHNNGHGYDDILKAEDFGLRRQGAPFGITFVNDSCPVDTSTTSPCYVGRNETRGSWVCRTLFDVLTGEERQFSACVDSKHFLTTDQCDCCGGVCPSVAPCGCACNITNDDSNDDDRLRRYLKRGDDDDDKPKNKTGVLVTVGSTTQCVPAAASVKIVTGSGFFGPASCVTTCP